MCKPCFCAASEREYIAALERGQTKQCSKCGEVLPVGAFGRQPGGKHGAKSICIGCARTLRLAYEAKNPETMREIRKRTYRKHGDKRRAEAIARRNIDLDAARESSRRHYAANPEYHRKASRDSYQRHLAESRERALARRNANIDAARERDRRWRAEHPDKMRAAQRSYRQRNPEKHAEHEAVRRARIKNAPAIEKIDRKAIVARDGSTCYLCRRVLLPHEITLDHYIPLDGGGAHTAESLRVACRPCNSRKWKHLPPELQGGG
jgi:5-methylcytosine-specific restriction endonuclease McrA